MAAKQLLLLSAAVLTGAVAQAPPLTSEQYSALLSTAPASARSVGDAPLPPLPPDWTVVLFDDFVGVTLNSSLWTPRANESHCCPQELQVMHRHGCCAAVMGWCTVRVRAGSIPLPTVSMLTRRRVDVDAYVRMHACAWVGGWLCDGMRVCGPGM